MKRRMFCGKPENRDKRRKPWRKRTTNLFKTILPKCFRHTCGHSCNIPGNDFQWKSKVCKCWLVNPKCQNVKRIFLSFTWHTPIRQDMGQHGSPSGQFQSTWRLLDEYQFCKFSGSMSSIMHCVNSIPVCSHLCSTICHTSCIYDFDLCPLIVTITIFHL